MQTHHATVSDADEGERLDVFVARLAGIPRARASELIASGSVRVDGAALAKSHRLVCGEQVEVHVTPVAVAEAGPLPEVHVVFEDDHLLVVDKAAGVVVHPARGLRESTLVDALAASGRPLAARAGPDRPGVVHRLDRDVSGLLVVAKTDAAHEALVEAMSQRRIGRQYLALVSGSPQTDRGTIDAPVGRHTRHRTQMAVLASGKPAVTHFRVAERHRDTSVLRIELGTGRTHQIRTHLEAIGHPIVGDRTYGGDPRLAMRLGLERPFLHAVRLTFEHPSTGKSMSFDSELAPDLSRTLDLLREETAS